MLESHRPRCGLSAAQHVGVEFTYAIEMANDRKRESFPVFRIDAGPDVGPGVGSCRYFRRPATEEVHVDYCVFGYPTLCW